MTKQQLAKYADVLIWGLCKARKKKMPGGAIVRLITEKEGLPLAEAVYERILKRGWHANFRLAETTAMERAFYRYGDNKQLSFIAPGSREFNQVLSGSVYIMAPDSLTHLKDIEPSRLSIPMVARKPFRQILERREEKGNFGWTLCSMPTRALAEKARMTEREYTRQIIKACYLDARNPVREWENIYQKGKAIKKWLNGLNIRTFRVESASMDLTFTLGEKRQWLGLSGHNIPSFEIFTSPDWRGTQGIYYANLPTYRTGNYVEGVRLEFRKGSAVKISAKKGEAFVKKMLATDRSANKVGEFSLTDKRFSKIDRFMADTLFDENFGGPHGNCHLAVGSCYTDSFAGDPGRLTKARKKALGFNDSSLHWDLVNTEKKRVTAKTRGGRTVTIYENGLFTL